MRMVNQQAAAPIFYMQQTIIVNIIANINLCYNIQVTLKVMHNIHVHLYKTMECQMTDIYNTIEQVTN